MAQAMLSRREEGGKGREKRGRNKGRGTERDKGYDAKRQRGHSFSKNKGGETDREILRGVCRAESRSVYVQRKVGCFKLL